MNATEARNLKVGDRLLWDGGKDKGFVRANEETVLILRFDKDFDDCYVAHGDDDFLKRVSKEQR